MKRHIQVTLLFLGLSLGSFCANGQESGKMLFNSDWKFIKSSDIKSIEQVETDPNLAWREVSLPHDWSVEGPFSSEWASGTGFLPGGIGWYKKTFDVTGHSSDKRYTLYFDGVYKNSEVWLNGHYLGKRPNGFMAFYYDISPFLQEKDNQLFVKVDHTEFADSRYYTGSGIYRNVYLIKQEAQYIKTWGVAFSTPEVSNDRALVKVNVDLGNVAESTVPVEIKARLVDADGKEVAGTDFTSYLPGKGYNSESLSMGVERPHKWSPDNPYLYTLQVSLWNEGQKLDEWQDQVGIRSFRFDANEGFFLNGENLLLKGVCIHHDAGALGAAVPAEVWKSRLKTLKSLGCNAIRMSHYPHQDYLYDLCDEMGFLVQDEAFDEWEVGKNKWIEGWNVGTPGNDGSHDAFAEWGVRDVQDMVRRNRNHASIIMWSIGNEIDYPNDPYSHPVLDEGRNPQIYGKGYQQDNPPAARLGELAAQLASAVKAVDQTRPVTAALAGVTMSNHTAYPDALDIVGYNYQEYRYEEDHAMYPDRVIYGSENGDALEAWWAVSKNPYIASQFLWTAFDFLGEARPWPIRSSGAGIIDMAGQPKPDFYFRKSLWNETPMVYLAVTDEEENVHRRRGLESSWTGTAEEQKWVACYANVEEVELFLNGRSMGKKAINYDPKNMPAWEIPFQAGKLEAVGYDEGKKVATYILNTPGKLKGLDVQVIRESVDKLDPSETVIVDITLMDKEGNIVPNDDQEVVISLDGDAKVLGMESGDLSSHENYQSQQRKTFKGKVRAYIQVNAGTKITVSSKGLRNSVVNID